MRIILLGYLGIILIGALALSLPVSSASGQWTPPQTSLFTSVSSVCVTGLIVVDTATYWSLFGQIVILLLIQIGGLGIVTVLTMATVMLRGHIGLHDSRLAMQSAGAMKLSGVSALVKKIHLIALSSEGVGAVLLAIRFIPEMGPLRGIYYSIFHSVSAFCNAGFDLMGSRYGKFSSFTFWRGDPLVCITIMALIITGGLGFFVWDDVARSKLKFKKFSLHSKIVICTTAVLLIGGAVGFFIFERGAAMNGASTGQRVLDSLFQSVTARTAGFNTVDQARLSPSGNLLTDILMLIGGSPGSTAGGMKTTTVAALFICVFSSSRNYTTDKAFKRRIEPSAIRQAGAILTFYLTFVLLSTLVIMAIEPFGIKEVLFECCSAIGTVGVTTGITPSLCTASRIIIMLMMFTGRIGGMSLAIALAEKRTPVPVQRPTEKIMIG